MQVTGFSLYLKFLYDLDATLPFYPDFKDLKHLGVQNKYPGPKKAECGHQMSCGNTHNIGKSMLNHHTACVCV